MDPTPASDPNTCSMTNSRFSTDGPDFSQGQEPLSPILSGTRRGSEEYSCESLVQCFEDEGRPVENAVGRMKGQDVVCEIERMFAGVEYLGLVNGCRLRALRALSILTLFHIQRMGKTGLYTTIAQLRSTGPGTYSLSGSCQGHIAFVALEKAGRLQRLAEASFGPVVLQSQREPRFSSDDELPLSMRNCEMTLGSNTVFSLRQFHECLFELRFAPPLDPVISFSFAVASIAQSTY